MTDTPDPEVEEYNSDDELDWDNDTLGSMADYADDTEPDTEDDH